MTNSADSPPRSATMNKPVAYAWFLTLAVALAAGMIAWAASEPLRVNETGMGSRGGRIPVAPVVFSTRNGMTAFGLLGLSLSLGLGVAGGLLCGSIRSAALAGLVGAILGGAAGVGAAKVLVPFYVSNYSSYSLSIPLLVHAGLWSSIAIAAGLAFGLGVGGPGQMIGSAAYAAAGSLLAAFTLELTGFLLFPAAQTDRPLPLSSTSRLFANLLVALMIAAALAWGASRRRPAVVAAEQVAS